MKRLSFLFIAVLFAQFAFSQVPKTPLEFGFNPFQLNDPGLGEINVFVSSNGIEKEKPLLLLVDGSGHTPLYALLKKQDGSSMIMGSLPFDTEQLSNNYHVAVMSKPGTPFLDSLEANSFEEYMETYPPSEEYTKRLSLDWRAEAASKAINYLIDELPVDKTSITAIGYSEGGQVVPKLAVLNRNITKIVNIVGGGLNQFNDFIAAERLLAQQGIISADSAQVNIDHMLLQIEDIYNNPTATDKFWLGHTYLRWASFCKDVPLDNMLQLDIPILMIAAGNDSNSPISGLDYVPLEFLRQQKKNLTYKVYPNCDHWFTHQDTQQNLLDAMLTEVIDWVEE